MNLIYPHLQSAIPGWSRIPLTENHAYAFCETENISVLETDLIDHEGEYRIYRDHRFVFLNKFLRSDMRNWVLWHEIGHAVLHHLVPCGFSVGNRRRLEYEAQIVAGIALMPAYLLELPDHEIVESVQAPWEAIKSRRRLFERFGV